MQVKNNLSLLSIFLIFNVEAHETYLIERGDTLSGIVQDNTSSENGPLYGEEGRIHKILSINPQVENPNIIYVGKSLYLRKSIESVVPNEMAEENVNVKPGSKDEEVKDERNLVSNKKSEDRWSLNIDYGLKHFNYEQAGDFGPAEFGVNVFHVLNIGSRYRYKSYSVSLNFNNRNVKYEARGQKSSKTMNSFELMGGYKSFRLGISSAEKPVFRSNHGRIELTQLTSLNLLLGYEKEWLLNSSRPTFLSLGSYVAYILDGKTDNMGVTIKDSSGYSLKGSAKLTREILRKENYKLNIYWPIIVSLEDYDNEIFWRDSSGQANSKRWDIGSQLGLELVF